MDLNETNSTNQDPLLWQKNIEYATFGLFTFLFIVGTVLNATTIGVILQFRQLRQKSFNLLLVYLAVVDIVSCLITAPGNLLMLALFTQPYPVAFCRIVVVLHNFSGISSITGMAEIAVLRVICILRNVKAIHKILKNIIFANIVIIPIISVSRVLFAGGHVCGSLTSRRKRWVTIDFSIISSYGVILFTTYAWIAWYVKIRAKQIPPERRAGRLPGGRYDIATIKTCVVNITSYLLSHLPLVVYGVVVYCLSLPIHRVHYNLCIAFAMLRHVGNPVIIFCTSKDFRKHFRKSYNKICRSRRRRRIIPIDVVA